MNEIKKTGWQKIIVKFPKELCDYFVEYEKRTSKKVVKSRMFKALSEEAFKIKKELVELDSNKN
jgi:hypothetical protein